MMRDLRAAIAFLTRIPVPVGDRFDLTRAAPWFPIAGAIVGGVMAYRNESDDDPVARAQDGLGTLALDRQRDRARPTTGKLTFRW